MTKSTITREQITSWMNDANYALEEPLNADDAAAARAILAMGSELLAAMDSEPEELPLDYLQGHKDGLEWASQLAKANHPETGDWLYDDPIELAKAIRKGPDMPPAPDSEPVAYADPQAFENFKAGSAEREWMWKNPGADFIPLYRNAQPAPLPDVVSVLLNHIEDVLPDDAFNLIDVTAWNAVSMLTCPDACRAAMLAAAPDASA